MSDFLDNLIAKNAGDAGARAGASVNTIRPYLPSRFEPSAASELAPDSADATELEMTVETTPHVRAASPVVGQPDERLVPTRPAIERRVEDLTNESPRSTREQDSSPVEAHAPIVNEPAPRASAHAPGETLVERVRFVERETVRPNDISAAPRRGGEHGPVPSTLLIVERDHAHDGRGDEGPRVAASPDEPTTLLAPADAVRARDEDSFPTTHRERGRQGSEAQPPDTAAQPASAPDIHVTIGRVEIRAAAPPATRHVRRNAPQPMTLEEYLRRRTSGEHR